MGETLPSHKLETGGYVRAKDRTRAIFYILLPVAILLVAVVFPALYLSGMVRPPRPMFHNHYFRAERDIFPFPRWRLAPPVGDSYSNEIYADFELNILAVLVIHEAASGPDDLPGLRRDYAPDFQTEQTTFFVRGKPTSIVVSDRDYIVVARPNTNPAKFPLESGQAKRLFVHLDFLSSCGAIDDIFDAIIAATPHQDALHDFLSSEKTPRQ